MLLILHFHSFEKVISVKSREEALERVVKWREEMKKHYPNYQFKAELVRGIVEEL